MHTITKGILAVSLVGSFGVWGYALSGFADRVPPDTLDDSEYAADLEAICEETLIEFDALPNAEAADDNVERARQITGRNEVLTSMVNRLGAVPTSTERDAGLAEEWLADWRTYIAERQDYADRFAEDENAIAYFSAVGGERIERRISRLAATNLMFACETPEDVG